ncbi:hypothetical protein [Streptomyces ficellus]|uniref:Uncharacterized protein n=1 Tax=Streptomyces ficellus TaxID=1977088 RepID=A0A6I6FVZ4_9ACTN|nr:hypothetical protein [Streptomyces ficellus]QGV81956.1 hypothetical protein EIZ62_29625 [Streptomyces ficellus]
MYHPGDARGDELVTGVGVDLPKALTPLPERRVRPLLGCGLSGREGMGAVLAEFLTGLSHQARRLKPCDAAPSGAVVVDLVWAWLAQASGTGAALPPETRRRALLRRWGTSTDPLRRIDRRSREGNNS